MILLPHVATTIAACLCILGATFTRIRWGWGPVCLAALAIASVCLCFSAQLETDIPSTLSFRQDPLSIGTQWLALLLAALFTLMALAEQRESETAGEHFGLLLFVLTGMMLVAVANDLIVLFLALELIGVSAFLLLYLSKTPPSAAIDGSARSRLRASASR